MKPSSLSALLLYFAFVSFLFCLPGRAFPKATWLSRIHFDKWVHIGIFATAVWICLWAMRSTTPRQRQYLFGALLLYGLLVELVQHFLISNRSFDVWDLLADAVGITVGFATKKAWDKHKLSNHLG